MKNLLGYIVTTLSNVSLIDDIYNHIKSDHSFKYLSCMNPHSYVVAKSNSTFRNAIHHSGWIVPDGIGIVYASKLLKYGIKSRITGFDIFSALCNKMNSSGSGKIFFLGSTDSVLSQISTKFAIDYPNLTIVGTYSPPYKKSFSHEDNTIMLERINTVKPDILWVGMTSPKQDIWIFENFKNLNIPFAAGIGAVFDFYCGNIKRSHPFFQKIGLEWLPRLIMEPKRLWKRMLISAPIFTIDVIKSAFYLKKALIQNNDQLQ